MPILKTKYSSEFIVVDRTDPLIISDQYEETEHSKIPAYTRVPAGHGFATVFPDMDFETYSEAGFVYLPGLKKWQSLAGKGKRGGLPIVGMSVYARHPSTEVLSLAYDLKNGRGEHLWVPGMPPPFDLFEHIKNGGLIESHNCGFEFLIWEHICRARMGWPELPINQQRDSAEKARAAALPGALGNLCVVLQPDIIKDKRGDALIRKFCIPKNPTKSKPDRLRIFPEDEPKQVAGLYDYNAVDIKSEADCSIRIPDLHPDEEAFALATRYMNRRGVGVDIDSVKACLIILEQAYERYNAELYKLTGGAVTEASQLADLTAWLNTFNLYPDSLDDDAVKALLALDIPDAPRRALEIRSLIGSAGVKKLYAMVRQSTDENRLEDLFIYHGARTGRDTGSDVQPQNLVKTGPRLRWCENDGCGKPYGAHRKACPHCGTDEAFSCGDAWSWEAVDHAIEAIKSGSLDYVETVFGDAVLTVSGCIRGMFVAGPGKDLIASDYSSIEAVVTAMLAGEEWRIEAFRQKKDIYLASAAPIMGRTYEWYMENGGKKHPDRQKIGKPAELGLGFGGWIGAWYQFDKSGNFSEYEVKQNIIAWREASPMIVKLWGGQVRGKPWAPDYPELFGLEGAAIAAVQNPGQAFAYRMISYQMKGDALYCRLPSGRLLTYHRPRLGPHKKWDGQLSLSYEGWNTNPKMGPVGWIRIETYGGRLTENVVQATARDIMRDAVLRLEASGYPIVLRVHDELVAEVPEGFGSIEEFEYLMGQLPAWAAGWPVRAVGGWRGKRYRKD